MSMLGVMVIIISGGGLGGTRKGGPDVNTKYSGRQEDAVR